MVYVKYETVHLGRYGHGQSFSVSQEGLEGSWLPFRYRQGYRY